MVTAVIYIFEIVLGCRMLTIPPLKDMPVTSTPAEFLLSPDDQLRLVEALDALVPRNGDGSPRWTREGAAEQHDLPYLALRNRLAANLGFGFYDTGRSFLETALHYERYTLTDALHGRLTTLLKQPDLTRRTFRAGMIAAFQELRDVRHYKVKMPLKHDARDA